MNEGALHSLKSNTVLRATWAEKLAKNESAGEVRENKQAAGTTPSPKNHLQLKLSSNIHEKIDGREGRR